MKKRIAAMAVFACAGLAQAGILYDNTSVPAYYGLVLQNETVFNSFSTGAASGPLSGLEVILTDYTPSDGGLVSVGLYADSTSCASFSATDCPGSFVANLGTIPDAAMSIQTLIAVSLTANPVLSSGTRYWISLGTAGGAEWADTVGEGTTGTGVSGEFWANGLFPYTTTSTVSANTPAGSTPEMQVVVGAAAAAPEPGALWLCVGGLAGLLFSSKRMRGR